MKWKQILFVGFIVSYFLTVIFVNLQMINANARIIARGYASQSQYVNKISKILIPNNIENLILRKKKKNIVCTMQYDPVECSGRIYGNLCLAIADGQDPSQCEKILKYIAR